MFHTPAHKDVIHPADQVPGTPATAPLDFDWTNHGTIVILVALTEAAIAHAKVYVKGAWNKDTEEYDEPLTFGRNGYAVEPRMFGGLLANLLDDGFNAPVPRGW